jgi:hypothetical protein
MTLALRTPAELLRPDSSERIASGIAIIWADPQQWGGIFDPLDNAEQLRAAHSRTAAHRPTEAGRWPADYHHAQPVGICGR